MSKVTYQTRLSDSVHDFCNAMGELFGQVERDLYQDIKKGKAIKDLKREYQIKYQINARQFNSIHAVLKGKISSRDECYSRQIKETETRIGELTKKIKSLVKKLKKTYPACGIGTSKSPRATLKWQLHHKRRKLATLVGRLATLKNNRPSLIFGSKKLWSAQFNLAANGYTNHEDWLTAWRKSRSAQFTLVGSKDEKFGNQNCQLLPDGLLKIRVPRALESRFGRYYLIEKVRFPYGQENIEYALNQHQALTFRIVRKEEKWYAFVSLDLPDVPTLTNKQNGMIGIDLNPNVIGWSYCDGEGNLKAKGQIYYCVRDRSKLQTKATFGDVVKELVSIAQRYQCPIAIESLDFSRKRASMKEQGVKYSRMLSNFAYSSFHKMLVSRAERNGVEVITINPAFSSLIGLTKFMSLYGLSSDTAAALVIARRALRKSERIPASYARTVQVDTARHVWSFWNALNKKLKGIPRHGFFISGANSPLEDNRLDELSEKSDNRFNRKWQRTSRLRRDSSAPIVDKTVRLTSDQFVQLSLF